MTNILMHSYPKFLQLCEGSRLQPYIVADYLQDTYDSCEYALYMANSICRIGINGTVLLDKFVSGDYVYGVCRRCLNTKISDVAFETKPLTSKPRAWDILKIMDAGQPVPKIIITDSAGRKYWGFLCNKCFDTLIKQYPGWRVMENDYHE